MYLCARLFLFTSLFLCWTCKNRSIQTQQVMYIYKHTYISTYVYLYIYICTSKYILMETFVFDVVDGLGKCAHFRPLRFGSLHCLGTFSKLCPISTFTFRHACSLGGCHEKCFRSGFWRLLNHSAFWFWDCLDKYAHPWFLRFGLFRFVGRSI